MSEAVDLAELRLKIAEEGRLGRSVPAGLRDEDRGRDEAAAAVAKQALATGSTIRETVIALGHVERGDLTEAELDVALDLEAMTRPHD